MKLGVITAALLAAPFLLAQTASPLKGDFAMAEEGVLANGTTFASLARITISESGVVTGTQSVQGTLYDLQGALQAESDGSAVLSLTASTTNSDSETVIAPVSYRLVRQPDGGAVLLRTNPGVFAAGSLEPLGSAASPSGTYFLIEEPSGRPAARLAVLNFDASGTVSGFELVNSVLASGKRGIKGTYQTNPSGSSTLSLTVTPADEEGVTATENYAVLATATALKAVRTDTGSSRIVTFEK